MFDAALSRVFLGVHWRFDAFASQDVLNSVSVKANGTTDYKTSDMVRYTTMGPRADRPGQLFPIGGVPLGIGIANDIFQSGLRPTPQAIQPSGRNKCGDGALEPAGEGTVGKKLEVGGEENVMVVQQGEGGDGLERGKVEQNGFH